MMSNFKSLVKALFTIILIVYNVALAYSQNKGTEQSNNSRPFVLGTIEELDSKVLNEKRVLNIYLPDGYNQNDTTRYPVIYLLDGSADEDFIHVVGLVQFNTFPWVNMMPKSIVVGIATVDRRRDFTFPTTIASDKAKYPTTGHSDKFIAFIQEELQPFINRKYRTNTSKMIIGQSLGGLLTTEILLKKPTLFNNYLIISPSLWWDNDSLLDQPFSVPQAGYSKIAVYIGVGKEGLTPTTVPHVMEVDANLLTEKLKKSGGKGMHVYFDYLPQEDHGTILHQAISNAFRQIYRNAGAD